MNLIIKAFLINNIDNIESFDINVEEKNLILIEAKLKAEYKKIVNIFKEMKKTGIIQSVYIPKNKQIQNKIDNLIRIKHEIKKSLNKIKEVYK